MSKFKTHHYFIVALSLTLMIPEGLVVSVEVKGSGRKWAQVQVDNNNKLTAVGATTNSEKNVTSPQIVNEGTKRSNHGTAYDMFPQSYYTSGGQKCTFSGGRIQCRNRRDSSIGNAYGEPGVGVAPVNGHSGHGNGESFGLDTYAAASAVASQVPQGSYGVPMAMASGGWGWGMEEDDGGDFGLEGLKDYVGLLGLLGLKGLKGVKGLKTIAGGLKALALPLLLPLLPILLPLLLLPLLLPLLLLLFIPIPVIVGPGRRGIGGTLELVKDVLNSDQCVERISCEITRLGKAFSASTITEKVVQLIPKDNPYKSKISAGVDHLRGTKDGRALEKSCAKFTCNLPTPHLKFPLVENKESKK